MKSSLLLPVFNRPQYLSQCLESLLHVEYPEDFTIMMINDASTDPETLRLFNEFAIPGVTTIKLINGGNKGIQGTLLVGYELAFNMGFEVVINLDSDGIVKPQFVKRLLQYKSRFWDYIITGFNSVNKNRDGYERHEIIEDHPDYSMKKSVGGINFCIAKGEYEKYVRQALKRPCNWDHEASIASMRAGKPIICLKPSVVQHIGFDSSLNHNEEPDIACDFDIKELVLGDVTLFGIDSVNFAGLQKAAEISQKNIKFGAVVMLQDPRINSKEEYSRFIIKELFDHISTPHVLIIQHDGYVLDYKAWKKEWLQYDYIGATWCFKDGKNVGNGGFSLRSKKLMEAAYSMIDEKESHPEDAVISRTYRPFLENLHGIKFAPEEVANKFSIEAHGVSGFDGANVYSGQFGFHGYNVDYSKSDLPHKPAQPIPKVVSNGFPKHMRSMSYGGRRI